MLGAPCGPQVCPDPLPREVQGTNVGTEGVWMSVTPTDDALIVGLDFEGQFDLFSAWPHLILTIKL